MKIRQHRDDKQLYELYTSELGHSGKVIITIWATIHEDGLDHLDLTPTDIENFQYKLVSQPDYEYGNSNPRKSVARFSR